MLSERERADLAMVTDQLAERIEGRLGASMRFYDGVVLVGVTVDELRVLQAASRLLLEPNRPSCLMMLKGYLAILAEPPTG